MIYIQILPYLDPSGLIENVHHKHFKPWHLIFQLRELEAGLITRYNTLPLSGCFSTLGCLITIEGVL